MGSILDDIAEALPQMPAKLARAARFALDHPEQIALNSMRGVAGETGVTAPTMQRLALHLGFATYDAFRGRFRDELLMTGFGRRATALRSAPPDGCADSLSRRLALAVNRNIDAALTQDDGAGLRAMAQQLVAARMIHVAGSGAVMALAHYMVKTGAMILPGLRAADETAATTIETISTITAGDAFFVIGASPYARRSLQAARHARQQGATVLALTDRRSSPLVELADLALIAPTESRHYYPSMVALMATIEAILATVVAECDTDALDRIAHFEALRRRTGAYLE